jgi:hypothetical protein
MLTALIAGSLLAQIEQSPRLKSTLPNGAQIYIERLATPGRASVALAVSTAGMEFKTSEHGWVHLVEHLVARGKGDMDRKLESQGMMLSATTTRDGSLFQISGRPDQMAFAIQCLRELADPLVVTEDDIKREIGILREEYAIRSDSDFMTEAAWIGVLGNEGGGPFGNLESMAAATPANVAATHDRLFAGGSVAVAVTGDVDVALTGQRLTEVFGNLAKSDPAPDPKREALTEFGADGVASASGAVRGVVIQGVDDLRGAAALMAAVGFAADANGAKPVYTFSTWPGLVFVSSPTTSAIARLEDMTDNDWALLYPQARKSMIGLLENMQKEPSRLSGTMAVLIRQNPSLNSERVRDWFLVVSQEDFLAAGRRFHRDSSFTVVGGAQ